MHSFVATLSALLTFRLVQKVLNNNSTKPSVKKETHCFYRYRIWHRKHGSTLGLGGLWAGLLGGHGPPAHSLVANLFSSGSQTSEVGRLISASSFFPDTHNPVSLRGSVLEKIRCEKELGRDQAATRKEIGSPSKPQKSALRKPRVRTDWPSWYPDMLGTEEQG